MPRSSPQLQLNYFSETLKDVKPVPQESEGIRNKISIFARPLTSLIVQLFAQEICLTCTIDPNV